jgi:hypothetical protein
MGLSAHRRRLSTLAATALLSGMTACGSGGSSKTPASGGSSGDAGQAGSGGSSGQGGNGGQAGSDAGGSGGTGGGCTAAGPVTYTYALGAPLDGHTVIFQNADGSVASSATTDAAGKATGTLPCDGLVTLALGDTLLWTLEAEPGDDIVLKDSPADLTGVGDMKLDVAQGFPGAAMYTVGCAGPATDLPDLTVNPQFPIRKVCLNPAGKFHELAVAVDATYHPLAFSFVKDITPAAAPALTTVTLPIPWRTDLATLEADLSGLPPAMTGMSVTARPWLDGLTYFPSTTNAVVKNGAGSATAKYPPDFGSMLQYTVITGNLQSEVRLHRRVATPPATLSLTGTDFPPALSNATLDKSDPARPVASWQGDTSAADGVTVFLTYQVGTTTVSWNAAVRPGDSSFRFPELPASISAPAPSAAAIFSELDASTLESSTIAGFADFRQNHFIFASSYYVLPKLADVAASMTRTSSP